MNAASIEMDDRNRPSRGSALPSNTVAHILGRIRSYSMASSTERSTRHNLERRSIPSEFERFSIILSVSVYPCLTDSDLDRGFQHECSRSKVMREIIAIIKSNHPHFIR